MRDRSDEQLMMAYAGGSAEAFEQLYERYRGPLYRYILRMAGDPATANDLYQGSWEKIIKARGRYSASAPYKAWMYRIAHNHIMDHFRRQRPETDLPDDHMESSAARPDEQLTEDENRKDLLTAIDSLPPEQKDALLLKLETGLDLQAIAEVTGVKLETAKSRLRYAVRRLKETLGDQGTGGD
jgi:RNA polymerase sigma-70 factor (ECF subfamily)